MGENKDANLRQDELDERRVESSLEQAFAELEITITAEGHKSSEGDGRTAADIERELEAKES